MQIAINEITLAKIFELSQLLKEECKDKSNLEEVAQELMKTLCQTIVTDCGNSAIVLSRFFKSCSYSSLTDDIQNYIKQREGDNIISPEDKYLTLLGTWGDLEEWRCRQKSKNYKAFSLNDKEVLYKFPMFSAVFKQIGFNMPSTIEPDKSIIVDSQDKEYSVFYVKDSADSKLIPKQTDFVLPYGVKSAIGFGGNYTNNNIYAIVMFLRDSISEQVAKLFLSLNPAIKLMTLRHEMTGNIFYAEEFIDSKRNKPSVDLREAKDEFSLREVEYAIRSEEAMAMADELKRANNALSEMTGELNEKNAELVEEISVRKQMEEALLQSEKLKALGTITAGISHEFNNILSIISGNVQLLEETYKDHVDLANALRTIKKATNDGAKISGNMLKFTRTQKETEGFIPSDIRDLIRPSIDFTMPRWKNEAQAKGIHYIINTEGMKSVPYIKCNPTELREVFINIINNALDAMHEGGRLSVSTWSRENRVFVGISDTGVGMSVDVKKRIFDPFFTTKIPLGTGLGMSTVYGIINRHGGKIEVESKQGEGSTFTLQFPATIKKANLKATPEAKHETNKKSLRILVVDDEVGICNILDKLLSSGGHKVKTIDNGTDAIEIIKTESFDLVLCDLLMPNISGYDVVNVLDGLNNRPKIGIISGWGDDAKPIVSDKFKVDFVLKKPFDFSELMKNINEAFGTV